MTQNFTPALHHTCRPQTQLSSHFALSLFHYAQANEPESGLETHWRKQRVSESLLGFAAGGSGGAAPAGRAYAAAGSSPGLSHPPAPRTSSAAAHTPEGKQWVQMVHSQAHPIPLSQQTQICLKVSWAERATEEKCPCWAFGQGPSHFALWA